MDAFPFPFSSHLSTPFLIIPTYTRQNNITLCGESAGAVYVHAHICTAAPVRRAILQSGSLYLSPPLPLERGRSLISELQERLKEQTRFTLADCPIAELLILLEQCGINTLWLQQETALDHWMNCSFDGVDIIVGDVADEV